MSKGHKIVRANSNYSAWSKEEDDFLLASANLMTRTAMGRVLGRTATAIQKRLVELGRATECEPEPVPQEEVKPDTELLEQLVRMAWQEGHEVTIPALGAVFKRDDTPKPNKRLPIPIQIFRTPLAFAESTNFIDLEATKLINPISSCEWVHFRGIEEIDGEDSYKAWRGRGDCIKVHFDDEEDGTFALCFGFHKGNMFTWVESFVDRSRDWEE